MQRTFFKALDREFEVLGMKGKWVAIFLISVGACIVLAIILGSIFGSTVGVVSAILLVVLSFLVCMLVQARLPSRQIGKAVLSGKVSGWVIRRETLCRILLEDKNYAPMKKLRKMASNRLDRKDDEPLI